MNMIINKKGEATPMHYANTTFIVKNAQYKTFKMDISCENITFCVNIIIIRLLSTSYHNGKKENIILTCLGRQFYLIHITLRN